jgi:hypothetical protein
VMWLDHGRVAEVGDPAEVVQHYEQKALQLSREAEERLRLQGGGLETAEVKVRGAGCYDLSGGVRTEVEFGEPFEIRVEYECAAELARPYFIFTVQKGHRSPFVCMMSMLLDGVELKGLPREGVVSCLVESPTLSPGTYQICVGVQSEPTSRLGRKWYLPFTEVGSFTVTPGPLREQMPQAPSSYLVSRLPPMVVAHAWSLDGRPLARVGSVSSVRQAAQEARG